MLGDSVKRGLELLGITQQRVEGWLGEPCNCQERIEKLNQLDTICRRVIKGKIESGRFYLNQLLEQQ